VTISSWLNFGSPMPPGMGSAAGQKILAPPYDSQHALFASLYLSIYLSIYLKSRDYGIFSLSYCEWGYSITCFGWLRFANEFCTSLTMVGLAGLFGACSGRRLTLTWLCNNGRRSPLISVNIRGHRRLLLTSSSPGRVLGLAGTVLRLGLRLDQLWHLLTLSNLFEWR